MFSYRQLKRSFYIWLIQQVGLAETVLLEPGFWESLWADWSPGYDPREDVAELRRHVTADNIANVIAPYRASFNPEFADPDAKAEALGDIAGSAGAHAVSPRRRRRSARRRHLRSSVRTPTGCGIGVRNHRRRRPFPALEQPELIAAKIADWLGG